MYDNRPVILALIALAGVLLVVVELVRRRRLQEEYSLLWLATGVALIVLAASRQLLDSVALMVGIAYPPSALFMLALGFMLLLLLQFSVVISRLSGENKRLAQEVAILQYELRQLAGRVDRAEPPQGEEPA